MPSPVAAPVTTPDDGAVRRGAAWALGLVALVAVVAAVLGAVWSGAASRLELGDPGPATRVLLPLVRGMADVTAASTLGLLALGAFVVPERRGTDRRGTAGRWAAWSALVWALSMLVATVLTFSAAVGLPVGAPGFWRQAATFVLDLDLLRLLLTVALFAAVVCVGAFTWRSRQGLSWLFFIACAGLVPLAFTGHASGSLNHDVAVNSYGVHVLAACLWLGGLVGLLVLRPSLARHPGDLAVSVRRYSTVALWCFVAVAASGVVNAALRVRLGDLGTPYGQVLLTKVALLLALGVAGAVMRARLVRALEAGGASAFTRLATLEVALMAAAAGLGAALGRTAPPVPQETSETTLTTDPAIAITGYPTPSMPTSGDWLTTWQIEPVMASVPVIMTALYLAAVVRLHRRGDRWPWHRTLIWVIGWALFFWVTQGGPAVFGRVAFSAHMVMHMALMMAVPLFLAPAGAITLALRALEARRDKTLGPREWLLAVVHSPYMRFWGNPVVAAANFFLSLVIFYWSGLFPWALTSHAGHLFMIIHFTITGYLFVWVLAGIDPGPPKWEPPMRLLVLFATLAGHAFFGVAMMMGTRLLAGDVFERLDVPWVTDLLKDQQFGGGIAWGIGELPTALLAILVGLDWARRDENERRRSDRRADRDHDAELRAYNEQLAGLASRDSRS